MEPAPPSRHPRPPCQPRFPGIPDIGRPQGWGVAAFGQPGVARVIDILNRELADIMKQAGTPTLASITPAHVSRVPAT